MITETILHINLDWIIVLIIIIIIINILINFDKIIINLKKIKNNKKIGFK